MNLPNADAVEIPKEKITDYLLNPLHPDGASKAVFFAAHGFKVEHWQEFAAALRELAAGFPVVKQQDSRHGKKYVVDGPLTTPSGKTPLVRTVWIIDQPSENPRFITAYPQKKGE
jgi:hypothetical protein